MAAAKRAATQRDRPLLNANFVVELAAGKGSGFAEVVFGPFAAKPGTALQPLATALSAPPVADRLVLRRGATGALDLYAWSSASSFTVTVRRAGARPSRACRHHA